MKPSFEEFIKYCYPSLHPYQLSILKQILTLKEPFDMRKAFLKQRENERAFLRKIDLHWSLLNNRSVYDAFHRLYFHFVTNEKGEVELRIDQYSQPKRTDTFIIMDDLGDGTIPTTVFKTVFNPKIKSFTELMEEVDEVLKGIT